jgi:dihydrofolate synthase/folylpolyglutamate synthase
MDVRHLAATLAEHGAVTAESGPVGAGISAARHDAGPDDLILVCGSLFTVGEAKAWLAGKNFEGIRG